MSYIFYLLVTASRIAVPRGYHESIEKRTITSYCWHKIVYLLKVMRRRPAYYT